MQADIHIRSQGEISCADFSARTYAIIIPQEQEESELMFFLF
jgi:hypothetical protein